MVSRPNALRESLARARGPGDLIEVAESVMRSYEQLSAGMVEGRVVSEAEKKVHKEQLSALLSETMERLIERAPSRAGGFLQSWDPVAAHFGVELSAFRDKARAAATGVSPAKSEGGSGRLRDVIDQLRAIANAHPAQCTIALPADPGEVEATFDELGVAVHDEVKDLYRLCNGFCLYRQPQPGDYESPLLDMLPIHAVDRGLDYQDVPDRLLVFHTGNGDHLSCYGDEGLTWVDEWREGPQGQRRARVDEVIAYALSLLTSDGGEDDGAYWMDFFPDADE